MAMIAPGWVVLMIPTIGGSPCRQCEGCWRWLHRFGFLNFAHLSPKARRARGGFHGMDGPSWEHNRSRKGSKCRYSPLYPRMNRLIDREAAVGVEKLNCIMETS
jgi:hypothetical protein